MEKIKTIKKEDFEFDHTKIKAVKKIDIFKDKIEIIFDLGD